MSVWHVNSDWRDLSIPRNHDVTYVDPGDSPLGAIEVPQDSLSAPEVEALLPAGLSLWPRGAAWGSPDGEAVSSSSLFAQLTRAILAPISDLYKSAWLVLLESRSRSIVNSLEDWEKDYGLPSECGQPEDIDQRFAILRSRVQRMATITPRDFVNLAAWLGFTIAIEEPKAFRCGQTPLGSAQLSSIDLPRQWVVYVRDIDSSNFQTGIGEVGITRLLEIQRGQLECEFKRLSPGWTQMVFNYGPHLTKVYLVTENGDRISTENGDAILVAIYT